MRTRWMHAPAFGRSMSRSRAALRTARWRWDAVAPGELGGRGAVRACHAAAPRRPPTAQRAIHHTHPQGAGKPAWPLDSSVLQAPSMCDTATVLPATRDRSE